MCELRPSLVCGSCLVSGAFVLCATQSNVDFVNMKLPEPFCRSSPPMLGTVPGGCCRIFTGEYGCLPA